MLIVKTVMPTVFTYEVESLEELQELIATGDPSIYEIDQRALSEEIVDVRST